MEEMNKRIFEVRKALNLTQTEFGVQIGLTTSAISDIERDEAPITERTIIAICAKFNVNPDWLKFGEGKMFLEYDKKHDEFFNIFKDLHPALQDFLIETAKNLKDTQEKLL